MRLPSRCLAIALVLAAAAPAVAAPPAMRAPSYLLVDATTGEVLAERSPDRRLPMASTTKVMTALLALESGRLTERVTVPPGAVAIGESSARLVAGERIAVGDLVTGLLIGSGNDAAIALAEGLGGGQAAFVRRMNARARELGLRDTHFANPHGLDQAGHYSTVRDLVALARVAMREPRFRGTVARRRATIPGPGGRGVRRLESENTLLSRFPDADGIKTGHTAGAGYALVAHASRPRLGVALYLAVIGEPSEEARVQDARRMLEWGFRGYARPTLIAPSTVVARLAVRDRPGAHVEAVVGAPLRAAIRLGRPLRARIVVPPELIGPVRAGQRVGTVQVRSGPSLVATAPLLARRSVDAPDVGDRIRAAIGRLA